jgi:hypothetical protein
MSITEDSAVRVFGNEASSLQCWVWQLEIDEHRHNEGAQMDDEQSSRRAVDNDDAGATDDRTEERFDESPTFENLTKRFMHRPRTLEQAAVLVAMLGLGAV